MNTLEKERSEMKVRCDSLRQLADGKSTDCNDLKKQLGSLKDAHAQSSRRDQEENRELRSQLQAIRNSNQQEAVAASNTRQQQAETIEALKTTTSVRIEQATAESSKIQKQLSSCAQENINFKQRLQKAEASCQALGDKNYDMEVKLRKAHWSSTNPSPHEFVNMARKREKEDNLSQRVGELVRENGKLLTISEEYKVRNEVLWKYLPAEREDQIQKDLEALRQARRA